LTEDEIQEIRDLAERDDCLGILENCICPAISGHQLVKRGLLFHLLGGFGKNLENGTHLRFFFLEVI
jgi:DNA replicative helicase MCM subunit Mcm2 (Cdc46/Mcm family)